jgi:hypothetical protein
MQNPPAPLLDNWATFTDELFQMFSNHHLQTTSQNAILNIKMKEEGRVLEYLVRFNSHAVYTGWNDSALANHFYRGLPCRLKERFTYMRHPQMFIEMRHHALDFDQHYWEYQEELGHKPKPDAQNEQGKGKQGKNKTDKPPNQQNQPLSEKSGQQQTSNNKSAHNQKLGQKEKDGSTTKSGPCGLLMQKEKDEQRQRPMPLLWRRRPLRRRLPQIAI